MLTMRSRLAFSLGLVACLGPLGCAGESVAGEPRDAATDAATRDAAGDAASADAGARDAARDGALDASEPDAGADAGPGRGAPYPIVLAHGFFGFEDFAGVGFIDYFWRVREDLAAHGETEVFTPAVDPFNSSVARGAQLTEHVERIVAETGAARVVIIGHSQGGLDARVVAHDRPDLVAAVVTVATPHGASRVADVALGIVADERARDLLDALARAIAAPLYDADGEETSVFAALRQLSRQGAEDFDRDYPDAPGIPYWSIAGRSDRHLGGLDCMPDERVEVVSRWALETDPIDPLLSISESILQEGFSSLPNDGLVTARSSRWGTFLGCIPADHFDEMGQLLGDDPGFGNDFDHLAFYRDLVEWLRIQGY